MKVTVTVRIEEGERLGDNSAATVQKWLEIAKEDPEGVSLFARQVVFAAFDRRSELIRNRHLYTGLQGQSSSTLLGEL